MAAAARSTLIALFESRAVAEKAVGGLIEAGFPREEISVLSGRGAADEIPNIGPQEQLGTGTDAGSAAAVGGFAGFIGGILALAIPGIGPAIAAGPLAAAIMGAGLGAAAGGLVGALKVRGVPEADVTRLSDAIRHGRVLVSADLPTDRVDQAAHILDDYGALDVDGPLERVDAQSTPNEFHVTPEGLRAAHLKPGEGVRDRVRERSRRVNIYPGFTGMGPASNT